MTIFKIFVLLLNLLLASGDVILRPDDEVQVFILDSDNRLTLSTTRGEDHRYVGILGHSTQNVMRDYTVTTNNKTLAILDLGDGIELKINVFVSLDKWQIQVSWTGPKTVRHEDCLSLGENIQWYGGPEHYGQHWPSQKMNLLEFPYIPKENDGNAIIEPYWVNSQGSIFYVHENVPLFVDQNNIKENHLCLIAQVREPYSQNRIASNLLYDVVFTKNARAGHEHAVARYLGRPAGYPDYRMIQHPIWSSWARYKKEINESLLIGFAKEIVSNGFQNSQLEIDDHWEICYGALTVDTRKFPNFKEMVFNMKEMGFRVTLWVHPFVNKECDIFEEAESKGYLVKSEDGSVYTQWWNSKDLGAGYVDFTNPDATSWWTKRLIQIQNDYGIDSFKFDAGETNWSPKMPVQEGYSEFHPNHIAVAFARAVAEFGPMIELRTGRRTQDLPVFVRMLDKASSWTFVNGLPTLITTLLQLNINGYTLVLPDMIGGNGYDNDGPDKDLFVRWLQANTFMPSLQYSYVPWNFDTETVEICRKYTDLHAQYADKIVEAMAKCVADGSPVNGPIWWIDPEDQIALEIWDEFLLGDTILVAPVLTEGAISRDIYLPTGTWKYQGVGENIPGKQWLRNFAAPLDVLPYFIKIDD